MQHVYDIPPEWQFNKVLFVEKRGFNQMLKESGTLRKYNMAIVSTAGYAPRAAKALMQDFEDRGIAIYVLHDCDMFGYNIHAKVEGGGRTFVYPLQATDIGLKVEDVEGLGLEPEQSAIGADYSGMLQQFDDDAAAFFMPSSEPVGRSARGRPMYRYQRVELNALTNEQLLALIDRKIPDDPLLPPKDALDELVDDAADTDDVLKEALVRAVYEVAPSLVADIDDADDKGDVRTKLQTKLEKGENYHWATAFKSVVTGYRRQRIDRCAGVIAQRLRENGLEE